MSPKVLTTLTAALVLASLAVGTQVHAGDGGPLRYSLSVSGFALSDSADGEQRAISWNEVDVGSFLHVHILASLPDEITKLQGRYAKLDSDGNPSEEKDLGSGVKVRDGQFDFTLTHYILEPGSDYIIRVADDFIKPRCLATHSIRTAMDDPDSQVMHSITIRVEPPQGGHENHPAKARNIKELREFLQSRCVYGTVRLGYTDQASEKPYYEYDAVGVSSLEDKHFKWLTEKDTRELRFVQADQFGEDGKCRN